MNTKVFYMSYQPYFLVTALEMKKIGWEPVYFSVTNNSEELVKKKFPKTICHTYYDAIRGILPKEYLNKSLKEVSPDFFSKMSFYEEIAIQMFDRNDSHVNNFSYKERKSLFRHLVRVWMTILEDLSPKFIVFEEEPHQVSDYVVYAICCILEIKTIMFISTKFNQRSYPISKFEDGSKIIQKQYNESIQELNKNKISLPYKLDKIISNYRGNNYIDNKKNVDFHASEEVKKIFSFVNIFDFQKIRPRLNLIFGNNNQRFHNDQKEKNKSFRESKMKYLSFIYYRQKNIIRKRILKKFYSRIAEKKINFNEPYIFCSLSYQPEKTTCPIGDHYNNQILMIKDLLSSLPNEWKLIVKEHPSQFGNMYSRFGEIYRSKDYYLSIKKLKNVIIAPINTDIFKLIDNSKAVASVAATTGWESVVRGKPALIFGYAWYRYCHGVFKVGNITEIKQAISKIRAGYKIDSRKIDLFAKIVYQNSFEAIVAGENWAKIFGINEKQNGLNHADSITHFVSKL